MQRFIIKIAKIIIKEPIEKFIKLIFSLKISIENKTPNGIFKLFTVFNTGFQSWLKLATVM